MKRTISYSAPSISALESGTEADILVESLTSVDGEDMILSDNEKW